MSVHHYRAVKLTTLLYIVEGIVCWQNRSSGQIWDSESLDDNFIVIKLELGISAVSNRGQTH